MSASVALTLRYWSLWLCFQVETRCTRWGRTGFQVICIQHLHPDLVRASAVSIFFHCFDNQRVVVSHFSVENSCISSFGPYSQKAKVSKNVLFALNRFSFVSGDDFVLQLPQWICHRSTHLYGMPYIGFRCRVFMHCDVVLEM